MLTIVYNDLRLNEECEEVKVEGTGEVRQKTILTQVFFTEPELLKTKMLNVHLVHLRDICFMCFDFIPRVINFYFL